MGGGLKKKKGKIFPKFFFFFFFFPPEKKKGGVPPPPKKKKAGGVGNWRILKKKEIFQENGGFFKFQDPALWEEKEINERGPSKNLLGKRVLGNETPQKGFLGRKAGNFTD
ncbi:hypothetical protein EBI_27652 [Enterocytozoon bieneusi H348]|nr:hypothetical protein EBI_27652 [Enterocytozoon bieneusi H348]|eukprot:XP_002650550.1 hypothetical protein EBI_27652 [Enterocytozoon bieneusi H348]